MSLLSLNRHSAEVTSVEFSAQGDHILTASSDETAIVWLATPFGPAEKDEPAAAIYFGTNRDVFSGRAQALR